MRRRAVASEVVTVALVPAVLVTAVLVAGCSGSGRPSPVHSSAAAASGGLASREFVYSVEDNSGSSSRRSTLVVDVADPYVARVVTRADAPPGGAVTGGSAWGASGLLLLSSEGAARQVQQVVPGFTGGDSGLDVALPLAAQLGWVRRLGSSTVAGTTCALWLSGPPLDSGSIDPATGGERTTSCVDGSGRILADTWTRGGRVLRVRRLVASRPGPRLSRDGLDPGVVPTPLPSAAATQLVRPVEAKKLASLMGVTVPPAPAGLRLDRSTALAVVAGDGTAQQEGASYTFIGAGRLTVVTFTRFLVGAPRVVTRGRVVRLERATGRMAPVVEGLAVDLVTRTGLAVRVQSDLPPAALTAWLTRLPLP